jgi:hypothetical protein
MADGTTPRSAWTTPKDVLAKLRKHYDRGDPLRAWAQGVDFEAIGIPLRGPTAGELGVSFDAARAWVRSWETGTPPGVRLEYRNIGGRLIGANKLPARAWIDSYEQLWTALGATAAARQVRHLLDQSDAVPAARAWVATHPHKALSLTDRWNDLLATVTWIARNPQPGLHLRQIAVPGVDTKFIEAHRAVLTDWLDATLDADRIDTSAPRSDFVRRFGFEPKPDYIRARTLAPDSTLTGPFREAWLRVDELAHHPLPGRHILVVENETTYLALPPLPDTLALWGGGYAIGRLANLPWLSDRDLIYWGDIDTHGFAILNRLRTRFPHTRSVLMDEDTLVNHRTQWVQEKDPTHVDQPALTAAESQLFRLLAADSLGAAVRLEQERIGFAWTTAALHSAIKPPG